MSTARPRVRLDERAAWLLACALVLILASGLRWHDLDAQSLWNDEGNSLRLAQRSVPDLLDAAARDIHPPGYYLALKGWIALAGTSEFGLRALSALQGVLTAAVALRLGRRLFGPLAGVLAGLLVALSPFAVYYSQEARMYAQLGLLSVASMALLVEWLRREATSPRRAALHWALALALVNAAGLYTQYSFPFTLIAEAVLVAAWLVWRRGAAARRVLRVYAALNALTLLLFLPWLPTAWDQVTNWPRTGVALSRTAQVRTILTWITYGNTAGEVPWLRLLWPTLLALAVFLPNGARRPLPRGWRSALPAVWGGVVIAALLVSGAYREANLKFLLPAQVAAALLIGAGAARLWRLAPRRVGRLTPRQTRYTARFVALVAGVLIVVGQADALRALYRDPVYARDDYRDIAAFIRAHARPGDAVILDAPNQQEVFSYYDAGELSVYALPRGLGGDDAQTRAEVESILASHSRVWALFWGEAERDPNRVVQAALDAGAYPVTSSWYGDVRLAQYAVLGPSPATAQTSTDARFGTDIRLTGYTLSSHHLAPGDVLGVTLFWTTDTPLAARYQVTVQLLAPDGSLVSQHDAEPANNRAPTSEWTPGQVVIDPHGLPVPLDRPPGPYQVIVGLYDPAAPLDRLPVTAAGQPVGDVLSLGPVEVTD